MRLKSFHGPSLTDAMRQVREALGQDAIIVATRDDDMGGVRVTAAIDDAEPARVAPVAVQAVDGVEASEAIDGIAEALARHHTPSAIAERLLATATQFASDDPVLALGAAFDAHLQFQPIVEDRFEKPLVFIGPPGAGKTLCTAKFATRLTLAKKPVTVISTDTERAGGMEQLAAFTRLLKIQLIEVEDSHALRDMIASQKPGQAVIVDTPGRNPFNEYERQQVQAFVNAAGGDATLVLPAGFDAMEALDMAQEFRSLGATRLVVTRLEMTRRLGGLLRLAFESHLPLANFSISSKVTEAPHPFNPVALAKLTLAILGTAGLQQRAAKKSVS
ncbi:MAG: GTPase [Bdellovibrionales bacterium]